MAIIQKICARLYREAKYLSRDIYHTLGLYHNFYKQARGSRIMVYHGICQQNPTRFNTLFLTQKTFEAHLKFYKKHFNVVSLADYYQQKFSDNKFNICLTFDDGFTNNHKYVLPLLAQYKIPATFFITAIRAAGYDILWNDFLSISSKTGPQNINLNGENYYKDRHNKFLSTVNGISLADQLRACGFDKKAEMMALLSPTANFKTNKQLDDYWLQMTTEQIRELSASPFLTIGAHGYYHNDLAKIGIQDAAEEMSFSKQYLENLTGKEVNSLAFPYGSYSDEVIAAAKQTGYKQLLATDFLSASDHTNSYLRERFTVNPFISVINQMYATIKHKYE
ncbi:polysaccharide deacetylase family protein [Mucilaginibacter sp.]|uniref:polysaccharide deacetylase family protein n=1 Tax=Mucilaginibacter sp. TaxID=1882438 RepID=UPI003D0F26E3